MTAMPEAWIAKLGPYGDIARRYGDIAGLDERPASRAALADGCAAWIFGDVLTVQPEFWTHLTELRWGADAWQVARRYVRRARGRRIDAVAAFLERAATSESQNPDIVQPRVWNTGTRAWSVEAPLTPGQPQRRLRSDAVETITRGAVRVVRRGAGRCGNPVCSPATFGVELAADNRTGLCSDCVSRLTRPRELEEAEKTLFMHLVPAVVRDASSPARARRERRAA